MVKLQPLEFIDCLIDSPDFRENLNKHEKELEKSSQQIKRIIKEIKDLLAAAKSLSRAQRTLSKSLKEFNFECIGSTQTDDEQVIADSLKQFSKLISSIEEERDNMLDRAHDQIVLPLEDFRKVHIGGVKENKKKYDKKTAKFCQAQERFLNMSSKKPSPAVVEADASLGMLEREYLRESLSYVLGIQEVQERIKFEFVEIILRFISDWLVFYHLGHEVAEDAKDYLSDLQLKVQKTRENFDETRQKAQELKNKYMDSKMKPDSEYTKQGYLYLMEKKFTVVTWSKYYCTYKKQSREFSMLQYNQMSGRSQQTTPEIFTLSSCIRRLSEFEKRYCFDLIFTERSSMTYTFQALSEEDIKAWLDAMDGKEPTNLTLSTKYNEDSTLDEVGFAFVKKCIEILEKRGLEEEGLYRIGGVSTKITKLLQMGLDRKKTEKERLSFFHDDQSGSAADVLESKTIASALKQYLRHLSEPLMTFRLHHAFIAAAKQETRIQRINEVHQLIHKLPKSRFEMLDIVIRHLKSVALKSDRNKMSVFNLGVVFGPTLLRAAEETVAAILDIKFNNVVIEILIENYDKIFKNIPPTPKATSEYMLQPSTSPSFHRPGSGGSGIAGPMAIGSGGSGGHNFSKERTISVTQPIYHQPQPVVRVVAKSNYTEQVMSSSLQNVSNGLTPLYSKGTNHYPTYEAKPTIISSSMSNSSSSTSPLIAREQHLKSNTSSPPNNHHHTLQSSNAPLHHHQQAASLNSSVYANTSTTGSGGGVSYQLHHQTGGGGLPPNSTNNHMTTSYDRALHHHHQMRNNASGTGSSTIVVGMDGGGGGGVYNRVSALASSDSNLANRKELSIYERINSTSSSNESVCSSSGGVGGSGSVGNATGSLRSTHGTWSAGIVGGPSNEYIGLSSNSNNASKYGIIGTSGSNSGGGQTVIGAGGATDDSSPSCYRPKKQQRIKDYSRHHQLSQPHLSLSQQQQQQQYLQQQQQQQQPPHGKQSFVNRENLRVRTLYACLAENDGELSFEPNQIITNVRRSNEPGWLDGTLNGKSGLIPENYVEILK
ncbi:rho GTPase-activating protein Graf [Anopheles darlingi]|uniref:Putative oligophrenin-1 n=1 Tax=Anopheles darlingi TaxID=43151 RepID=A0A2M4CHA7_ANODA|nr:rho GTPase-activating protein Graf [Anopheles darlingi]